MSVRRAKRIPAWRDTVLFLLGFSMMAYEAFIVSPRDFLWPVMATGGILAGVPGWAQLLATRTAPTEPLSSPSPEEPSPLPPPSSSSG